MNLLAILRGARRLIAEDGWCQFTMAVNRHDMKVDPSDPDAHCYCLLGSIWAVIPLMPDDPIKRYELADMAVVALQTTLKKKGQYSCLSLWNDNCNRNRYDVIALFDETIAAEIAA